MPPLFCAYFTAINTYLTAHFTPKHFCLLISYSVKYMIHKGAESMANICCNRGWIQEEIRPWCSYMLEKWLRILLFFAAVLLWAILSGQYVETSSFLIPFYFLRRRMGGCHARSGQACFLISIGSVIIVSSFIGTWILAFPSWLLIIADMLVVAMALILYPEYPPQVHFTAEEKAANSRKKNVLLILLLFFQFFSFLFIDKRILSYSFCGIAFCVVTVIIQKQKGRSKNEKTRKNGQESCGFND